MSGKTFGKRIVIGGAAALVVVLATACGMMTMMKGTGQEPPAAKEFGIGPRTSVGGMYVAALEPATPFRVRKLQSVNVRLTDAHGAPIEGATIAIDGGMPQHGHGLPTSPRVTAHHDGGIYQIDGVRFSMGGWWEFRLAIAGPAGADTVTFNLKL